MLHSELSLNPFVINDSKTKRDEHMRGSLWGALRKLGITAIVLCREVMSWLGLFVRYHMRCPHHGGKSYGNKKG